MAFDAGESPPAAHESPAESAKPKRVSRGPKQPPEDPLVQAVNLFLGNPDVLAELRSRESPDEVRARLKIADDDAAHERTEEAAQSAHERFKERFILWTIALGIGVALLACGRVIIFAGYMPDERKTAFTVLASILTGLGSYALRGRPGK